ncbi:hypothetical protein ABPG74_006709 [Tetrahymena malaccensis]
MRQFFLVLISIQCLLKLVHSFNINTYIPGYDINLDGNQLSQNSYVIVEFNGGDQWYNNCGNNCNQLDTSGLNDLSYSAVSCRNGYSFNPSTQKCEQCPANCVSCGYIYKIFCCLACSEGKYLIPSLDLKSCEECGLDQCLSCRYAKIESGYLIDHTNKPYVVISSAYDNNSLNDSNIFLAQNFSKYCLYCADPFFVNYNGQCEKCDLQNCEQCYYGTIDGVNSSYTLKYNFLYQKDKSDLILKCASCAQGLNQPAILLLNGACQPNLSALQSKDRNCSRWSQYKILPNGENFDSTYFYCTECMNGYGYDASKQPQDRICDQPASLINIKQCTSFYYVTQNGIPQPVTCVRCSQGYTASAERGCVSCSSGLSQQQPLVTCLRCSLISPTGFNYTQMLISGPLAQTQREAIEIERQNNLPFVPFCTLCSKNEAIGACPTSSCFDEY